MARAHPEQHVPIQFTLHHDHPLFRFLEQERGHLGQSRAGYARWLLEQQFLRVQEERATMTLVATSTPPLAPPAPKEATQPDPAPEPPTLEPDDDLLASFVS